MLTIRSSREKFARCGTAFVPPDYLLGDKR
jgi:hypothetical protein